MAPVGMFEDLRALSWFSAAESGIISAVVFLVLSVTLLALCLKCRRSSGNAYDVNGVQERKVSSAEEMGVTNLATSNGANEADVSTYMTWRNHKNMPTHTLDRSMVTSN